MAEFSFAQETRMSIGKEALGILSQDQQPARQKSQQKDKLDTSPRFKRRQVGKIEGNKGGSGFRNACNPGFPAAGDFRSDANNSAARVHSDGCSGSGRHSDSSSDQSSDEFATPADEKHGKWKLQERDCPMTVVLAKLVCVCWSRACMIVA